MLLYAIKAESRCLRTLTDVKVSPKAKYYLLSKLTRDYFYFPACVAAFDRICSLTKSYSQLPGWDDVLVDPVLEEDYRAALGEFERRVVKTKSQCDRLINILNTYRKIRLVYFATKTTIDALKSEKVEIDKVLDGLTEAITLARSDTNSAPIFVMGEGDNSKQLVKTVLSGKKVPLYKTGFKDYDDRTGGLPTDGVMIIAATTSGGKSTVLTNLLKNMYRLNSISVFRLSLEMGDEQETRRLLSCLSGVPLNKFIFGTLTPEERQLARSRYQEFSDWGVNHECKYAVHSPEMGIDIEQTLALVQPYGYKVIAIDYITLLAGTDSDQQWRILSAIAARCKQYTRTHKCLIILLAQLDEESDKIRYSRALKEHSDVVWIWNLRPEDKEAHAITIRNIKTRDGSCGEWVMQENFACMQVSDAEGTTYGPEKKKKEDEEEEDLGYANGIS